MAKSTPLIAVPPILLRPDQQAIVDHLARYKVVACGRRWGKTELGKQSVLRALTQDNQHVYWLAPTYHMAGQVWRDFKRYYRPQEGTIITEHDRLLQLVNGSWLSIRSTHTPDNLRGAGLDYVVMDEAAFMRPEVWGEIVRPMLLDRQGHALMISSPNGKNWFWEAYQMGIERGELWASFQHPTRHNPALSAQDLLDIQKNTPERIWRQEYEAEFVDDMGQVFRNIRACAIAPQNSQPVLGERYVAGVDWGREGDYTVMVVLELDSKRMVAMDRFNQVGWEVQRARLKSLVDDWKIERVLAESNSIGSVNIEALERDGVPIMPFVTTSPSKTRIIEALVLALECENIQLLPDEILIQELSAYSMKRLTSGAWQYSAPRGMHDDCVMALALALECSQQPRITLDFV
jgi:phage terminase large subunit-like protein